MYLLFSKILLLSSYHNFFIIKGKYFWPSGASQEGEFKDDKLDGQGRNSYLLFSIILNYNWNYGT